MPASLGWRADLHFRRALEALYLVHLLVQHHLFTVAYKMHLLLSTISPEILDSILGFGYSTSTLDLWLSGDKQLQRNISQGVTSIHFFSPHILALTKFPRMLPQLTKLRSLVIDRDTEQLLADPHISECARALPPTLTKLVLRFTNSASVFFPETASTTTDSAQTDENQGEESDWSLAIAFPLLNELEISTRHNPIALSTLPPHLTSLAICYPKNIDHRAQFFLDLPRQLLHFTLLSPGMSPPFNAVHLRHLPPNLITLDLTRLGSSIISDGSEFAFLPRTLTILKASVTFYTRQANHAQSFPPGLLCIERAIFGSDDLVPEDLGLILPSLTRASIHTHKLLPFAPSMIRKMPPTLTQLITVVDMSLIEKQDWPCNLKKLQLCYPSKNVRLDAIPSGLLIFTMLASTPLANAAEISLLPRSLTKLVVYYRQPANKVIDFPPRLIKLSLRHEDFNNNGRRIADPWITVEVQQAHDEGLGGALSPTPEIVDHAARTVLADEKEYAHLNGAHVVKCFPFHSLPRSLTTFNTTIALPASQLKHMPSLLTTLRIHVLFKDLDYRPVDELRLLRASPTFRTNFVSENFDWSGLSEASLSSLLPRSLTCLHISRPSVRLPTTGCTCPRKFLISVSRRTSPESLSGSR